MVHIAGSITGPHFGVNKWSTSEITIKLASEDSCPQSFQRGVQSFRRFLVFWFKNRLFKKGMVAILIFLFFFVVVVGGS